VAIVQISRITQRKGLSQDLPSPLAGAELGWATDTRQLFIGNGTLADGAPVIGNTEILTEFSDVLAAATAYTYKGESAGYTVQTGTSASTPVSQSLQSRLDSYVVITDFGATGDGVTDVTANINNALYQLYCREVNPQIRRGLYFPAGTYIISDTLNIPPYCKLYGDGPESSIISFYVSTWTNTVTYASGVLVKNGSSYYRSAATVPIGIAITNTAYWTATTLPSYIFRTADSLQQTGDNIGTNGALPPGKFEISDMNFTTNMIHDGCYIEAAQDCSFESVNIAGPETTSSLTTAVNNTACVRWNTTPGYVCSNIEWNHSSFSGMVWGTNTAEQIEGVTFSNCAFDTLYQGVYLGSTSAPAVGPTGFRIVQNNFDNIYAEGIVIVNVGLNGSAYNVFYDVGNHFNGTALPATSVIDIDAINNVSIGDMFERTTQFSATYPRISFSTTYSGVNNTIALGMNVSDITFYQNNSAGATPYNYANQLALGTYQRMAGITDTLADNVSSARTLLTFDATAIRAVQINYSIVRGTAVRTGTYIIVCGTDAAGTNIQGSDSGVQNSTTGQTFSVSETGSVVSWKYVTTSTGTAGTIYYSVTKLA
jgi:hypothetical protein